MGFTLGSNSGFNGMHIESTSFRLARRYPRIVAFTLIEMLVVIGVIAIFIGTIGLSIGGGNKGVAMQNAQGTLLSSLSGARAKAALYQTTAAIFVNASPDGSGFMHELRIAILVDHDNNPTTPSVWVAKGDVIAFSDGIYLVPPASAFPPTIITYESPTVSDWTKAHSTAYDSSEVELYAADGTTRIDSMKYNRLIRLTERGTTSDAGSLILAPARVVPGATGLGLVFDEVQALRGARVSVYGVATLVEGLESFSN